MRQTLTVSTALIIGFILVLSPLVGMAAQRALTVDSLEKAYVSRVTALDAQIASTTKAMDAMKEGCKTTPVIPRCYGLGNVKWQELQQEKANLEFEKRSILPAYNLLKEALR